MFSQLFGWFLNAKHQRTDAFKLWFWRVPWTARRSNQSILKEINSELERLMLELWYFGHLMQRADSLEKTLMLWNIEGRRRGQQKMRWLDNITNSMDLNEQTIGDSEVQGSLACCSPWGHRVEHNLATEQQMTEPHFFSRNSNENVFEKSNA